MVYTFGLVKHANIRYRDSLNRLSRYELISMLHSLSVTCPVECEEIGGASFLTFACRELTGDELSFLSCHSAVVFMAEKTEGGLLRPLNAKRAGYLEEDLPEILKYKGKTSPSFLRLMINVALSLSAFMGENNPLTLLDPLCGKGTACFCALQAGMNAVGLDLDKKAVHEAAEYFTRYLKVHMLKHSFTASSLTDGKTAVPVSDFTFADSKDHFRDKKVRTLRLAECDTAFTPVVSRRMPAHLLVTDLPYGIQHAPWDGRKTESFTELLQRALPQWKKAVLPGGVAAVSFNTLTLPVKQVFDISRSAGWTPVEQDACLHFRHEVEQAVVRDVVFLTHS